MIAVIDSGISNVGSVVNMLKKAGAPTKTASTSSELVDVQKVVLPGVGAFDEGMQRLESTGLLGTLNQNVEKGMPVLAICLGMQLLCEGSEEGKRPGLGWIDGRVKKFDPSRIDGRKIPHMGWNRLEATREHPVLSSLGKDSRFYFVHSFRYDGDVEAVIAQTVYGESFGSVVAKGNIVGTQFHPEKSHRHGLALMKSFVEWAP